jgi:putative ABC transport system substrate-binding protein
VRKVNRYDTPSEHSDEAAHIHQFAGGAVVWPAVTHAQQSEGIRRIGVLMNRASDDPQGQSRVAAFQQRLQQLGWTDGGNVRIDTRWGADDVDLERRYAAELVALAPDIVLASGTLSVAALQRVSHSLPIVFVGVTDPVGAGFVDSLARPGGNATGFMIYEYNLSGKWLEFLKQIARRASRAWPLFETPTILSGWPCSAPFDPQRNRSGWR